jgi:hypothetical protein
MRTALIVCLLAFSAGRAKGGLSVKDYQSIMATKDEDAIRLVTSYIKGLGEGMLYYSIRTEDTKQTPLFCAPERLALQTKNYVDIIEREIKRAAIHMPKKELDEVALPTILLSGLEDTFPCKAK